MFKTRHLAAIAGLLLLSPLASHAQAISIDITPKTAIETATPTITWDARSIPGLTSCTASGGWSGTKALFGSETLPQINRNTAYGLICVGLDGRAHITWIPPTENTNGTALTDLAGFKIYYGKAVDALHQTVAINSPATTAYTVENLTAGDWFFEMTAFNTSAIESVRSERASKNIVQVTINTEASVEVKTRPNPPTAVTTTNEGT